MQCVNGQEENLRLEKTNTFSFVSSYYLLVVVMMFVDVEIA